MEIKIKVNFLILLIFGGILMYFRIFNSLVVLTAIFVLFAAHHLYRESYRKRLFEITSLYNIESYTSKKAKPRIPCPEWLIFPERERVIWLNNAISVLWLPGLKEGIETPLNNILAKLMEENKPKFLPNVQFKYINVGALPPVITAVKVIDTKSCNRSFRSMENSYRVGGENQDILIDFTLIFSEGEPNIVFGTTSSKQFAIDNIQMKARCRIRLCDFVNTLPGFSKIEFSLLERPEINYTISAFHIQVSNFPILKKWFNKFINDDIVDAILYPNFIYYELDTDDINFLLSEGRLSVYGRSAQNTGILKIELRSATFRRMKESSCNIYCLLKMKGQRVYKTAYFSPDDNRLNVSFNENFVFYNVADDKRNLQIFIINENLNGIDKVIARCVITISNFTPNIINRLIKNPLLHPTEDNITIGTLHLNLCYKPPQNEEILVDNNEVKKTRKLTKKNSIVLKEHVDRIIIMYLRIIKIKGDRILKEYKLSDLRVNIEIGEFSIKTKKCKSSVAKWNELFRFEIPFIFKKEIKLSLYNQEKKYRKKLIAETKLHFNDQDDIEPTWLNLVERKKDISETSFIGTIKVFLQSRISALKQKKKTLTVKRVESISESFNDKRKISNNFEVSIEIVKAKNIQLLEEKNVPLNIFFTVSFNGKIIHQTNIVSETNNPQFNKKFNFFSKTSETYIVITAYNKQLDLENTDKKIGSVTLPIIDCSKANSLCEWYALSRKGKRNKKENSNSRKSISFLKSKKESSRVVVQGENKSALKLKLKDLKYGNFSKTPSPKCCNSKEEIAWKRAASIQRKHSIPVDSSGQVPCVLVSLCTGSEIPISSEKKLIDNINVLNAND